MDTGSFFTRWGQVVILGLMQAGGLGIMTFTSLALYLWRRRVSFTDRIAVGQSLLHDPGFALGRFLIQLFCVAFLIELLGALLLFWQAPDAFTPFSAVFHAVSAFCNAGFSLFSDSLMAWKGDWGVNLTVMSLIFLGGIGFSVLIEWQTVGMHRFKPGEIGSEKTFELVYPDRCENQFFLDPFRLDVSLSGRVRGVSPDDGPGECCFKRPVSIGDLQNGGIQHIEYCRNDQCPLCRSCWG